MAAFTCFVVVIVILAVGQSQNFNFESKNNDYVAIPENVVQPTEPIISFGETEIKKISVPNKEKSEPNETLCPVTQLETRGPVNLYIHGAFATTNKGILQSFH